MRAPARTQPAPADPAKSDQVSPVVGWLAVISGPGRGQVLGLHYGVNDIGRGARARVRLDFGDPFIALDNQAAIIYTASSRRFYLQSIASETWLNERPAQDSVELTGGEVLQLGQTRLRFVPLCGSDFDWRDNA
ncbi:MAG: FHA domain-containing protein [Candidatus Competibacteraceae bacterium]|nr:FHA domain-containing protein [Candidatus Competibacteraceae bacterium]